MAYPNDPQGIAAERVRLNAKLAALGTAISAWTGDNNGRRDLQMQACFIADRLNLSSTAGGIGAVST